MISYPWYIVPIFGIFSLGIHSYPLPVKAKSLIARAYHIMWQNKDEYMYAEEDQMYETQVAFKGGPHHVQFSDSLQKWIGETD